MKSVCVFAGSSPGKNPAHRDAATNLGRVIAGRGLTLVYGAGNVGLMAIVADAALGAGGRVVGVIPQFLVDMEVAHQGLSELHVVSTMHERKLKMSELADGTIALPGGLGTLEELFEMLTWLQLGVHQKPCALLNSAQFYNPLLSFLDDLQEDRFINSDHRRMLLSDDDPERLLDAMDSFVAPKIDKWLDRVRA